MFKNMFVQTWGLLEYWYILLLIRTWRPVWQVCSSVCDLPEETWSCELDPSLFFWSCSCFFFFFLVTVSLLLLLGQLWLNSDWSELWVWQKLSCLTSFRCVQVHSHHQPIGEQHPIWGGHVTVWQVWLDFWGKGSVVPEGCWFLSFLFFKSNLDSSCYLTADQLTQNINDHRTKLSLFLWTGKD